MAAVTGGSDAWRFGWMAWDNVMKRFGPYLITLVLLLLYVFPGWRMNTRLDFFVPLSQSFLNGKIYVSNMRTELHEMVSQKEIESGIPEEPTDGVISKYYVIYPPMPAILLMPLVAIWGEKTNQSAVSILFSILTIWIVYLVFQAMKLGRVKSFWLTLLYAFGSSVWYHALVGSSWYFASICGLLMMFMAILNYLKQKSWWVTGLFIALAFLCRFPMILSLPFFLLAGKPKGKEIMKLLLPILVSILLMLSYNYARYGRLDNYGYKLLESRWYNAGYEYTKGSYDVSYFPRHIKAYFIDMPGFQASFPYLVPNMHGMAVWVVFPALLMIFLTPWSNLLVKASLIAVLFTMPAHFFHGGVGATQFGYRYMFDYLPFIMIIIALAIKDNFKLWHKVLFLLSIGINIWGVFTLLI